MKKLPVFLFPFLLFPFLGAVLLLATDEPKIPPMPAAVSGNAVAVLRGGLDIYSLMGIGPKKTWDDITNKVYVLNLRSGKWTDARPVPGVAGRLGASAIGVRGKIFLFGGFVVDGQGAELTIGDVNAYLPEDRRWYRGEDIPVPVDNAVIGVEHDRYVYLVGGRSKNGPVNNVQVYDAQENTWSQATPFPGTPVFGHAGGLTDGMIVFVDGARKNSGEGNPYVASDECWLGKIEKKDRNKIVWSKLPPHPGPGRFAIVAGVVGGRKILFSGGTTAPHNYKGLDPDGKATKLSDVTFAYDGHGNHWETISEDTSDARSDSRGIADTPIGPLIVGGMLSNQAVTARVLMAGKNK
ncbi:MAG TPA: kelch repeat-containing protein [Terriglobales bacterium]|nr:kelch repeat-containing protein [Terriglobales bacterium]